MRDTRVICADTTVVPLEGQPEDYVPLYLFAAEWSVAQAGLPLSTVHNDPEQSFEAQLHLQELYGFDSPPYYAYATYGTWESGGRLGFPSSELRAEPTPPYYPVQTEQAVESLKPPDVTMAGMLPQAMRFSQLQAKRGLRASVIVGGTFTVAANICGLERLLRWMISSPQTVHTIVQRACDHLVDIAEHWARSFGADQLMPYIWESLATNRIMSPRHFGEFVFPYQRQFHDRMLDMGIRHILCHICGEQRLNLPYWAQIPMGEPGIVSVGPEINLEEASRAFPDAILMGNLDPTVIRSGTQQKVFDLATDCLERGGKHPGGFVLAPGCEMDPETPVQNVQQLVVAAGHCRTNS
jgi:uroporphyrinogen decarboxylase